MTTKQPIIRVHSAVYAYPDQTAKAVDSVSFEVSEGEFLAVLGHNGSGKSTLARMLNALILPSEGSVTVAGLDTKNPDTQWDVRRACAMVFQNPDNQLVASVVEEDVAFGLENLGVPSGEILSRVREALSAVGMEQYAESAPHMLSGGQKQRVAIAGVLAMKPRVIVFDESTAMLDPAGRESVMNVALRLNREEGMTVIWITHFMEEAAQADRILVMHQGKLVLQGTPREVFARQEEMRRLGLDVPEAAALAARLRAKGVPLNGSILNTDEMVVALCALKSKI